MLMLPKNRNLGSFFKNLFNAGAHGRIDSIEAKRTIITNYTIALALFWCIFYSTLLLSYGIFPLNYIFLFFTFYYTLIWRANYVGRNILAKLGVYLGLLVQVTMMSYSLENHINVNTFYI